MKTIPPLKKTLKNMIRRNMECTPDKVALIEGDRQYSFKELGDRTYRMGNALLALGLKKGDRVAVLSHNSIESAESYFSIPNAGLVLVILNFRLAPPEILTILSDAKVSAIIVNETFLDRIEQIRDSLNFIHEYILIGEKTCPAGWRHYEDLIHQAPPHDPAVEVTEDDLAALMYTSGTTGVPKGCMATHGNFYHVGESMSQELNMGPDDSAIIATPLFHVSGEVILMNGVHSSTPTIIMPKWDVEEFMRLVEKYKITTGVLATPMLLYLTESPHAGAYRLDSLKKLLFAGAPVTSEIFRKAIEKFGNIFVHGFGATETLGSICILKTEAMAEALANGNHDIFSSCGKTYAGMETDVVDEFDHPVTPGTIGEIRVRGLTLTLGYWNKDQETREAFRDGWFYTGDLCRIDEQGFMYIAGRKKDVIITGAENVFPTEVENVLCRHPAVKQAAVIGKEDVKWGERVIAIVVKRNDEHLTPNDIISFCRKRIAGYKVPKEVFFVENLPISPSGKLLKSKLKEQFAS